MTSARDRPHKYADDGFELLPISTRSGPRTLRVTRWSPEMERVLRESGVQRVLVDRSWEHRGTSLAFLGKFAEQIRCVEVSSQTVTDLSHLEALTHLEQLILECPVDSLDFTKLPELTKCVLAHPATLGNVHESRSLRDLALFDLKVADLAQVKGITQLRRLYLNHLASLATLGGIDALPLEEVHLIDLTRLRSIAPLTALRNVRAITVAGCRRVADFARVGELGSLERLTITSGPRLQSFQFLAGLGNLEELGIWNTPVEETGGSLASLQGLRKLRVLKLLSTKGRIIDVPVVGRIPSLEILFLDGAGELASLTFLRGLRLLREFALSRTEIGDGDLGVLLALPNLERVHSMSPQHSHYSHTLEQIDAALQARHPQRRPLADPNAGEAISGVFDRLTARGVPRERDHTHALEIVAQQREAELVQQFGSWESLVDAVIDILIARREEKGLSDKFEEIITVAGKQVTVTGRMVRGKPRVEMIQFLTGDA